jgi:NAD(P)-dependent dehydrogenase (short-subunit alcohol dehydrogenase family)
MMLEPRIKPGLRVLVTAGAAGIGRAIVEAFVRDGARVHICDVDETALAEARQTLSVTTSRTDVSDETEVASLFADAERALGGLDVLVNNAGIAGPTGGIEEISPADWRRTIDVNLNGQFYCAHFAVPLLRRIPDGAMVNIASVAGRLGYAFRTPYAASKWAIVGMTQSLARELGPAGIRVNAVLPGIVEGPRMEGVIRARAVQLGILYEEMEKQYLEKVSLRRMVSPHDVAAMITFLCSPAGRNISGQTLSVDGNVETL